MEAPERLKEYLEEWNKGDLSDGEVIDLFAKDAFVREYYPCLLDIIIDTSDTYSDDKIPPLLVEIFWNRHKGD